MRDLLQGFSKLLVVLAAIMWLGGCASDQIDKPVWEQVKLSDLADPQKKGKHRLETTDFSVTVIDIPADKLSGLDSIWPQLYMGPLHFQNREAFVGNGFRAGFGRGLMLDETVAKLVELGDKRAVEKTSIMITIDEPLFLAVVRPEKQSILYKNNAGEFESVNVGRGRISMRLSTRRAEGSRGVVQVSVMPAIGTDFGQPQLLWPAGFELKMSPGDFVLLAPERFLPHQATLESAFFSRNKPTTSVQVFIILCTRISE